MHAKASACTTTKSIMNDSAMVGDALNRSAGHLKKLLSNTLTIPFSAQVAIFIIFRLKNGQRITRFSN